jgi:hypothetical protein
MRYELWMAKPEDRYSLVREDDVRAQDFARASRMTVVWSTMAKSFNEASQLLYDHLGFGIYKPFLDEMECHSQNLKMTDS